jgi:hypothetical protein
MIIGLTGYAQSGKDTVANILVENHGYTRVAFADKIREYLYDMNPMYDSIAGEPLFLKAKVDRDGWEDAKQHPHIRRLLQNSGVAARKLFGENFWVNQALGPIGVGYPKIVITDVRFTNEADTLRANGAQLWRIKRIGVEAVNGHVSESQMDGYKVDQIFTNNGTLEDLEIMIKTRMMAYA